MGTSSPNNFCKRSIKVLLHTKGSIKFYYTQFLASFWSVFAHRKWTAFSNKSGSYFWPKDVVGFPKMSPGLFVYVLVFFLLDSSGHLCLRHDEVQGSVLTVETLAGNTIELQGAS